VRVARSTKGPRGSALWSPNVPRDMARVPAAAAAAAAEATGMFHVVGRRALCRFELATIMFVSSVINRRTVSRTAHTVRHEPSKNIGLFTARRTCNTMHSSVYAMARCPSLQLSVCLSVCRGDYHIVHLQYRNWSQYTESMMCMICILLLPLPVCLSVCLSVCVCWLIDE